MWVELGDVDRVLDAVLRPDPDRLEGVDVGEVDVAGSCLEDAGGGGGVEEEEGRGSCRLAVKSCRGVG